MALVSLSLPSSCAPANPIASSSFHLLSSSSPRPGSSNLALAAAGRQGAIRWRAPVSSFSFLPSFLTGNKKEKGGEKAGRKAQGGAPRGRRAARPRRRGHARGQGARRADCSGVGGGEPDEGAAQVRSSQREMETPLHYLNIDTATAVQRPKFLRPYGTIYQAINTDTLRAQNMETWPYFNQVTANLIPLNPRRVAVRFDYFEIFSLIPIKAPGSGKGELEITYLDEGLRVSRGDKGNLFVLKMVDPTYRVPS